MLLAANKFKTKKQEGEWNAPSDEQEQIIALQAEVEKLRQSKANKSSATTRSDGKDKSNKSSQATTSKTKWRKPAWTKITPKEGEPHKKVVDKKELLLVPEARSVGTASTIGV